MNQPLVSVVIPCYNVEDFLQKSMDSILNQTYQNLEIIVVEDCSTDSSLEILQSIKDERLVILQNEQNSGIGPTLNRGVARATGKYIVRHDSDDFSHLNRIETQIQYMEEHPETIVLGSGYNFLYHNGKTKANYRRNNSLWTIINCPVHHPCSIYRTEFVHKNNIKYEYVAEDYIFWNRIFIANNYHPDTFKNLDEILIDYNIRDGQWTDIKAEKLRTFKRKWQLFYLQKYLTKNGTQLELTEDVDTDFILNLQHKWEVTNHNHYTKRERNYFTGMLTWTLINQYRYPNHNIFKIIKSYSQYPVFGMAGYLRLLRNYLLKK